MQYPIFTTCLVPSAYKKAFNVYFPSAAENVKSFLRKMTEMKPIKQNIY